MSESIKQREKDKGLSEKECEIKGIHGEGRKKIYKQKRLKDEKKREKDKGVVRKKIRETKEIKIWGRGLKGRYCNNREKGSEENRDKKEFVHKR